MQQRHALATGQHMHVVGSRRQGPAVAACRHDFAAAIWRPALALAEVVLQKGKLLTHMGVSRGNKLYLCIEEAV